MQCVDFMCTVVLRGIGVLLLLLESSTRLLVWDDGDDATNK